MDTVQPVDQQKRVPEIVIDINNSNKRSHFAPTPEWCDEAALLIHTRRTKGKLEPWKSHLIELKEQAAILATKVWARMKHFLVGRCPSHLMNHWSGPALLQTSSLSGSLSRPPFKGTRLCNHSVVFFEQEKPFFQLLTQKILRN
jgi:hypothetical protein